MRRPTWRVAALFAVLTVVMTAPFSLHPASRVVSTGTDTDLMVWTLGWDVHALVAQPLAIFDANIFYPARNTLAYSENLIGSVIVAAPVIWLTGNPVLAMNLVVLVATMLCGVGAYVLGRKVGLSEPAAILCGLVFAFVPPRLARLDQVHLATIEWVPFALAYLHTYVATNRARDLRVAIAFFSLQALTSGHGAAFLTLAVAITGLAAWARGAPLALVRRGRDVGLAGVALLVPAAWVYLPYRAAQRDVGLRRSLDGWTGVSWSSLVASPSHVQNWLLTLLPAGSALRQPPDAWLFPGVLVIALAIAAFARRRPAAASGAIGAAPGARLLDVRWTYLAMIGATLWLAVGPPFGAWRWIYWWPGLSFVRVPSRFMLLGMLALAVLAGYGFDRIAVAWPNRRRAIATVVAGLLLAEFAFAPLQGVAYGTDPPALDRWLDTRPKPFAVVDLPVPDSSNFARRDQVAAEYMLHSMAHWQPIMEGYSGIYPPGYPELYWPLTRFPDEASLRMLARIGVTYAVVHVARIPDSERAGFEAAVQRWAPNLTLEHEESGGRIYSIHWSEK
jgi:hypothetical protein